MKTRLMISWAGTWAFLFLANLGAGLAQWPELRKWENPDPLPGTEKLESVEDLSLQLVRMNDAFLDRQIARTAEARRRHGEGNPEVAEERLHFGKMLGLDRDRRTEPPQAPAKHLLVTREGCRFSEVSWRAFGQVNGTGLLLEPADEAAPVRAQVIVLPDAGESPEIHAGLLPSEKPARALELARSGCRVLILDLIDRQSHERFKMSNREWLHRPAFELGRTLTGYELHKILSAADWLKMIDAKATLAVAGNGEGGRLALYAGALDERFVSVFVSGYFGPRDKLWTEPADRNVFGLLNRFGDAELARLAHPRPLLIHDGNHPHYVYRPGADGEPELLLARSALPGKPGKIPIFSAEESQREWEKIPPAFREHSQRFADESAAFGAFARSLAIEKGEAPPKIDAGEEIRQALQRRTSRLREEIEIQNRLSLEEAAADRSIYWKHLDTSSMEKFTETSARYREQFRTEVIGDFEEPLLPFRARSRAHQAGEKTVSYEVVLDVMDGVMAYGILTLPRDFDPASGEKRPVVVCQHGLEGSPGDTIGEAAHSAYKAFATRLAEEGFITFAPQNGYKYFDLFRLQQFKAQSIGKTLFSIIIPQHRQITAWLASLPFVAGDRIAFYGLSYGGKSAMRIPPLVDRYCLSICSADFNDWVWKNAAIDEASLRYSYANKGEYEIFEWNLGGTFNYAEMAALIAPRPFMVERGHFDGVAPDERVALEFARVLNLYQAKLNIGERCEIEWFAGPHTINSRGTFDFLRRRLWQPPLPAADIGPKQGTLYVVGGGIKTDRIYQRFIELAGGKKSKIVVVTTAAGSEQEIKADNVTSSLLRLGAGQVSTFHTLDREKANDPAFCRQLEEATALWFGGGRQWRLVDAYAGTLAEKRFREILERGGLIGGSSAGATIQGSYLARGDTSNNQIMMGDHEKGFGYLKNTAIDQHVIARNRHFDLQEIVRRRPWLLGIGVDEDTAFEVRGNELTVFGSHYVVIHDGHFWSGEGADLKKVPPREQRFFFLKEGDRYNLKTRQVNPSSARTQAPKP